MKAELKEQKFKPFEVVLTFESREEVEYVANRLLIVAEKYKGLTDFVNLLGSKLK